ncbi:hypothetical protein [Bacillus altitudinis]|nr:hypothetical protein [Bacillus altitudinis]
MNYHKNRKRPFGRFLCVEKGVCPFSSFHPDRKPLQSRKDEHRSRAN